MSGVARDSGSDIRTTGEERGSSAEEKSGCFGDAARSMVDRVPQCGCTLSHHRASSLSCASYFYTLPQPP